MFKKANKSELKIWMFVDIILFIILTFLSFILLSTFIKDPHKVAALIFSLLCVAVDVFAVLYFVRMVKAYLTYDARAEKQKQAAEIAAKKEAEIASAKRQEQIKLEKEVFREYQKQERKAEAERRKLEHQENQTQK